MKTYSELIKNKIETDRDPLLVETTDKIRVKDYIDRTIGKNDLFNHRLFVCKTVEQLMNWIEKNNTACVVKANNGWHAMKIYIESLCKNKKYWLKKEAEKWQSMIHTGGSEWAYSQIKFGFVVEKLIESPHYMIKVFVHRGKAFSIGVRKYDTSAGKLKQKGWAQYDLDWNKLAVKSKDVPENPDMPRPENLSEIIYLSEKIGKPFDYVRIDFFYKPEFLLSEITHYHAGGYNEFDPPGFDAVLARLI